MSKEKEVKVLAEFGPAQYHVEEQEDWGAWSFESAYDSPVPAADRAQYLANLHGGKYRVVDTGAGE